MTPSDPESAARPPAPGKPAPGRSRRIVRFTLAFVTAVLIVNAFAGEKGLIALWQARRQAAAVERALNQARDENRALREQARRLREDPAAIEDAARRDLGLIKPGEKLFIVKDVTVK
jgi:cell division protein FtsB